MLRVFSKNFRGFTNIDFELENINFIIGDNSSGKTTLLYLLESVLSQQFCMKFELLGSSSHVRTVGDVFSPYLENNEVTVGYHFVDESNNVQDTRECHSRIITFAKSGNKLDVKKASLLSRNTIRHTKIYQNKILSKDLINEHSDHTKSFNIFLEEHLNPKAGYKTLAKGGEYHRDHLDFYIMVIEERGKINRRSFPFFLTGPAYAKRMFGPIRLTPERYYAAVIPAKDEIGTHAPIVLKELFEDKSSPDAAKILRSLKGFGKESGLFDSISVQSYRRSDPSAPLRVQIEKNGKLFSLDQIGYGVSQILPIVVDSIISTGVENQIVMVQQPELHLHPKAQAAFGELVYNLSAAGVCFVLETHSDYLLDRVRHCAFKDKNKNIRSQIIFCSNTPSGNEANVIKIDENGAIVPPVPKKYRKFFLREEQKLMEMI